MRPNAQGVCGRAGDRARLGPMMRLIEQRLLPLAVPPPGKLIRQKSASHPTSRRQSSQTALVSTDLLPQFGTRLLRPVVNDCKFGQSDVNARIDETVPLVVGCRLRSSLEHSRAALRWGQGRRHGPAALKQWLYSQALRRRTKSLMVLPHPAGAAPTTGAAAHRHAARSSKPISPHASTHCHSDAFMFW